MVKKAQLSARCLAAVAVPFITSQEIAMVIVIAVIVVFARTYSYTSQIQSAFA